MSNGPCQEMKIGYEVFYPRQKKEAEDGANPPEVETPPETPPDVEPTPEPIPPEVNEIIKTIKEAGGEVDGYLRLTIFWRSWSDIDFTVTENITVNGEQKRNKITYNSKTSEDTGGLLDLDMNIGSKEPDTPDPKKRVPAVENIIYKDKEKVKPGTYTLGYTQYGVDETRADGADLPYLLIEVREDENAPMEQYLLIRKSGEQLEKSASFDFGTITYTDDGKIVLTSISDDVEVIKNHNFNKNT